MSTHPRTLVDVARERAEREPGRRAYTFLPDGGGEPDHMSHAELDRRARAIAVRLQAEGAAGQPVLVWEPPGLDYIAAFFGCLYAGALAVPVPPAGRRRFADRVDAIAADTGAALALGAARPRPAGDAVRNGRPSSTALRTIAVAAIGEDGADQWRPPSIDEGATAFLQYTSGSTGRPRGVMVGHDNLLYDLALIRDAFGHTERSCAVIWLPPYHDMGLVGGLLQPLFAGFPVVLMSPTSFLQRPARWLEAVSRWRATTSGGPNFAFELCVERIGPDQRAGLDLGCWEVAFNGAEPVRAATLERFADAFAPCGFRRRALYPCYGLAEATLWVTGGHRASDTAGPDGRVEASCGRPAEDERVLIVDPEARTPLPEGRPGEIWISGAGVAQGYWRRPEETEQTFAAHLADGEGPFLRTGDLGFLAQGELYVTGRLKDVVVVDGLNHHAEDLEWTAGRSHPALAGRLGAAFGIEVDGAEGLAIAHELGTAPGANRLDLEDVVAAIRGAVTSEHGLPVHAIALVRVGALPRTSSGKVRRGACRELFLAAGLGALREWRLRPLAADRFGAARS